MKAFVYQPLDGRDAIELRGVRFPAGVPVPVKDASLAEKLSKMPEFTSQPAKQDAKPAEPVNEATAAMERLPDVVESIHAARAKKARSTRVA